MTFFYDLNKKLDAIREKPEVTHGQLNERDMSRAAKGYEKYGKEGMEALAKAGREGKSLDPIRKKYDKYDEGIEDRLKDLDPKNPVNIPAYQRKAAEQGGSQKKESVIYDIGAGLAGAVKSGAKKAMKALSPDKPKPTYKPFPRGYEGSGQEKADYDAFTGRKDYGGLDSEQERQFKEAGAPMTAKQKSFAALAEPKDKITFADKIAGAKKEVDEMLGDVAAEAMKNALSGGQKKLDKNNNGKLDANDFAMLRKGAKAPQAKVSQHSTLKPVSNPKSGLSGQVPNNKEETDEGWDDMLKDVERRRDMRVGDKVKGHKGEIEKTATGIRHTRSYDPKTGETDVGDEQGQAEKRGRGRPKGTKAAIGAKGPSGKSKLMTKEADHDSAEIKRAMAVLKQAGYKVEKAEEELEEKAVSKKQQRFMGMVHATQKGEKAPSKAVAKVAKTMKKGDAEDFAATKHKGLPEKKKPEAKDDSKSEAPKKKKEKTEEAGGVGTPTASSGFGFGKGIYDSMNRELETMIAEGMNVSMSMNTDAAGGPSKSLTVTATDDDAMKLGQLLKMAGLGGGGYGGSGYKSACGCGTPNCSCGKEEMDEAYGDTNPTENAPDYPTNTETSADALQYAGGLNKPKSTGQTTVPVIASQEERQESYAEAEENAIKRMMEMAGIKEAEHTILATYRVKDPGLIELLSNESGAEMDVMDGPDGDVGILTVDTISFPNLSRMASKLAAEKKIQPIAGPATRDMTGKARTVGTKYIQSPDPVSEIAGQPASGMGAQVGDMIDYVNPSGEQPSEELIIQSGVQYDPDTNVISVPNSTQMADLHRKIEAAGWKKQTAGVRPNPMAGRQAQVAGDVPYQLGEEDELARMMEMAGVKKKEVDEEKTDEGNKLTGGLADDDIKVGEKIPGTNVIKKKDIDESILTATANLWKEYKGQHGV